jgi:DNA-directed RNA polymerase alpha subunit
MNNIVDNDIIEREILEREKRALFKQNSKEFCSKIENLVSETGIEYFDAILNITEEDKYEPEQVAQLLSEEIKSKLQYELENLSLIKKTNNRIF